MTVRRRDFYPGDDPDPEESGWHGAGEIVVRDRDCVESPESCNEGRQSKADRIERRGSASE